MNTFPWDIPHQVFKNSQPRLKPGLTWCCSVLLWYNSNKSSGNRGVTAWKSRQVCYPTSLHRPHLLPGTPQLVKRSFKIAFLQLWGIFLLPNSTASVSWSLKQASLSTAATSSRTQGKPVHKAVLSLLHWEVETICMCILQQGMWASDNPSGTLLTTWKYTSMRSMNKPLKNLLPKGKHSQHHSLCTVLRHPGFSGEEWIFWAEGVCLADSLEEHWDTSGLCCSIFFFFFL